MQHHTFICGTAKSKEQDAYYIYHNNRFWGSLHEADVTDTQIDPAEYRRLGEEYGFYLTEVVDPEEYIVSQDSDIEPYQVISGMENLIERIKSHNPNRIAFVGKNAATWFYRNQENREITHSQSSGHSTDRRNLDYGNLGWNYFDCDYFLLRNTHRHWNREMWMEFWDRCRADVEQFRRE